METRTNTAGAEGARGEGARTPRIRLRAWQRDALAQLEASQSPNFLLVATPGAGKTTFALSATKRALLDRRIRRFVVVVPTQHLKTQWALAAEHFGLHVDPGWSAGYGALPSDVHGVAVTYQQVAANPAALRSMVRDALVILDEIHHAGESRAWGDAVRVSFEHAPRRLALSGTPFRSDQNGIPFVNYDSDLAVPDYEYGYGTALRDRSVVRPVYFPRINGHMEWTAPGGLDYAATFDDPLTRELANQRLRTALSGEGEWLPAVIAQAHAQLGHLRAQDPQAAGLIIAMDQEHARGIATMMHDRFGVTAAVATSDDPAASRRISDFTTGSEPWMVAVRMVSEGVDIPRLRVGVYATNTVTELFFRQAVGRLVRWSGRSARQAAYMFIPDDKRLRTFAAGIAEARRHNLRRDDRGGFDEDGGPRPDDDGRAPVKEKESGPLDEQLSLFTAISAVPLDEQGRPLEGVRLYSEPEADAAGAAGAEADASPAAAPDEATVDAEPVPPPDGQAGLDTAAEAALSVPLPDPAASLEAGLSAPVAGGGLARRRLLREQNSALVVDLVHMTGKSHATVNSELNRRAGIKRVSEATVRQLEKRLEIGKKMAREL